ncbi:UNVERIFIED_CONTAM: D-aminoacyl-tRNA deacylase [Sesamum calycinum]|uniref:D-aminoacyl-tRNA deacylase n=1 Tax=Sesamum calycinum TaxID=2727403 RepID=A0AAW2PN61_9LAMI
MTLVGLLARVSLIDFGHCRRTAATRFNRGYIANYRGKSTYTTSIREMVTLVVATTVDPASIGPASALLSMPGWQPGPSLQGISSFVNKEVRLLKHDRSIVREDHLDRRWEEATGEVVNEVIFLSRHTAVSNRPALTIHPIGVPHLQEGDVPPAGGKPGWAAPPNPRIGPWLRLLKSIAESHNLTPEFEITLEATHHGPETHSPTMFVEIGSTEEYWKRQDAAQAIALLVWEGLGLGEGTAVGNWSRNAGQNKVLLGIGGGHYVPRHMDIVLKNGVWVGHLLSGYSLPMEDPGQSKSREGMQGVGGTWKEAIKVSFETTKEAFPGGEVLAHLDHKSFKSWQKNAIIGFLAEQGIRIGKPGDFC